MKDLKGRVEAASAAFAAGRRDEALASMRRLAAANPSVPEVQFSLGTLLVQAGLPDQAEFLLRRAFELRPSNPMFAASLGNLLLSRARPAEAQPVFERALAADARFTPAWTGLSMCQLSLGQTAQAEASCRRAIEVDPSRLPSWINLSGILQSAGRMQEAVEEFRPVLARFPDHPAVLHNQATVLNYLPADPAESFAAHTALGRVLTASAPTTIPPAPPVNMDPDRRLRIGYLSPDFREHSVARFVEPLFTHHNRAAFEVRLYYTFPRADAVTARLHALADHWTDAAELSPAQLLQRLRDDKIDILIDLAGVTSGHRLSVLAARAAPIQITAIGYPNTTGVPAIDYRLVDSLTDPTGDPYDAQAFATERLLRLDPCFLCFKPPESAPAPRSSATQGPLTFGSFNAIGKLSPQALDAWARILARVPDALLILKNRRLTDADVRDRHAQQLLSRGIAASRVQLLPEDPTSTDHLAQYHKIDIALDPFPYNGTTTTCEALWMGVPVVALRGRTHAGRVGLSLLSAIGLPELAADSVSAYEDLAVSLAQDPSRLTTIRTGLRERVQGSPLCDGPGYTRRFEGALRSLWQSRCALPSKP